MKSITKGAGRSFITESGEFYISYGKDKYGNPKFKDFCELDAIAHLIEAAPDMLQILKEIGQFWSEPYTEGTGLQRHVTIELIRRRLDAAIAKAEGE